MDSVCWKCGNESGDDWSDCGRKCPMPMSPHYNPFLKRLHVNQHVIRKNVKEERAEPPIRVKVGGKNFPASHVKILGESELIYSPDHPLSCGARLWLATTAPVMIDGDALIH